MPFFHSCKSFFKSGNSLKAEVYRSATEDLIEIYCLFIRSTAEYCSAVFGPSLTNEQDRKLKNIEKTSLRIILKETKLFIEQPLALPGSAKYVSYEAALGMCALTSLSERRAAHLLAFARQTSRHPVYGPKMFPNNPQINDIQDLRDGEKFQVNFSWGEAYYNSTIPTAQRLLNQDGWQLHLNFIRYIYACCKPQYREL